MASKRRRRGKGTIYFRADRGKWFYQYSERDASGGLHKLSKALAATTRKDAAAEAQEIERGIEAPDKAGLLSREDLRAALRKLRTAPTDPAAATPEARLLTRRQAADALACSIRTVARMTADGTLPAVYLRPGCAKSLRYRAGDLAKLTLGNN